jgi:hypothetical protein
VSEPTLDTLTQRPDVDASLVHDQPAASSYLRSAEADPEVTGD